MSKKMLIGVLAAVMLAGAVSASPVFAQNVNADEYVTEIVEIDDATAADKNGFVIENGVLTDYRGYETRRYGQ